MENIEIGNRIRSARKRKHMSMKELGKKVNLHESTVSRYEKGEIQSLDIEKLKEFAKALEVNSSYLIGWDEEDQINPMEPTSPYDALTQSKPWKDVFGDFIFTDEEIEEIINFAKYIISKRKDKL